MYLKKILTPFPPSQAGQLPKRLKFHEDKQAGFTPKSDQGQQYRGFNSTDTVLAPEKSGNTYAAPLKKWLAPLMDGTDQLYINAHCNRGLNYLAADQACKSHAQVTIPELITLLDVLGFQKTSQAKVKLWICHGASRDDAKLSFAEQFASAMRTAGYVNCHIFGYTESLVGDYKLGPTSDDPTGDPQDKVFHKRANVPKPALQALDDSIKEIEKDPTAPSNKARKRVWDHMLNTHQQNRVAAMQAIIDNSIMRGQFLPGHGSGLGAGVRASLVRREFF